MQPYDDFKTRFARLKRRVKGQGREWVRWGDTGPYGLTRAARHLGYLRARAAGVACSTRCRLRTID